MYVNPWARIAALDDILAQVADAVSNFYPQAQIAELLLKGAAIMLRHPEFDPREPLTAHALPYFGR